MEIANCKLVALVDKGSVISFMESGPCIKIRAPMFYSRVVKFRGICSESNYKTIYNRGSRQYVISNENPRSMLHTYAAIISSQHGFCEYCGIK